MAPEPTRLRLADLARQAGVSEATVSRVLNDRPGVSESARQAVLVALEVLGYQRPERLRRHSAGLVGLLTPELDNPIFPLFAQTIETTLSRRGYTPVLCTQIVGGASEDEFVEMLIERSVAGIVFVSGMHADTTTGPERYRRLIERPLPIVLVNGYMADIEAPFISVDYTAAASMAVGHLAALGHQRIGLISGPKRYVPVQRLVAGYTAEMDNLGLEPDIVLSLFGVAGGDAAATQLIERGVTAIVCGSDLMALGAIRAARAQGLKVPMDVSVVGFDDSPLNVFTDPPLTTVRQPVIDMSTAAVRALLDAINGHEISALEYMFHPELVVRGSTGPVRAA